MHSLERIPSPPAPRFEAARRWRPWKDVSGLLALAAGVALWLVVILEVAEPLGAALHDLSA